MPHRYVLKTHFDAGKNFRINYQEELTAEQLLVATAQPGPMLVIAGAGSGKTRTVTYRVAYLVESGVPLDRILLVTFTNKAAKEMLSRVELLLKRDVKDIEDFLKKEEDSWEPETLIKLKTILHEPANWNHLLLGHFHSPAKYRSNTVEVVLNGTAVTGSRFITKELKLDNSLATQKLFGVHRNTGITWDYNINLDKKYQMREVI